MPAAILLPQRFKQQPQQAVAIDRENELGYGLVHSYGVNVLGGLAAYDAAGTAHGKFGSGINGGGSGNSWVVGPDGYFINYDDAGSGTVASVALAIGDANGSGSPGNSATFSIAARILITAYTTGAVYNQGGPLAIYGSVASGIEFRVNTAGKLELLKQGVTSLGTSTGIVPLYTDVDVGLSWANGTLGFFINGVLSGTASVSAQTFVLIAQYYLGYAYISASNFERMTNGSRIYRLDVWNRALSASEHSAWSSNRWQVYKAQSKCMIFSASAGVDTQLLPAPGGLVLAPASPAMLQTANQMLVPAPGSLFTSSGAPLLAQTAGQIILPGTAQLVMANTAPTISQPRAIAPAPAALVMGTAAPALTQSIVTSINPDPGTMALAGAAPDISQTASVNVFPAPGMLALSGVAPVLARTANLTLALGAVPLVLANVAPSMVQAVAPAAPRYARPLSDVSTGSWAPSSGTSLAAMLSEVTPDDSTYIATNTASTCEIRLAPVVDPQTSAGQVVRYKIGSAVGSGAKVRLMQGTSTVAEWLHDALPSAQTVYERALTAAQCDAITDYADLRFQFEAI